MELLSRKPRVSRCQRARAASITTKPLQIIVEETEPCSSSKPSSTSTSCDRKAKRRQCNLSPSDIQIARDFIGLGDEDDVSNCADRVMLLPPQSAKLTSAAPSPDSIHISFGDDESFEFPLPPIPTPSKHFEDDIFALPSPKFNPRRAGIHSLMNLRPAQAVPCKPSPFTSEESSSESEEDPESDSEWYQHELSKILTVGAPAAAATSQKARPDSIFIPTNNKRLSRPSGHLDPAFPTSKRRESRQFFVPSHPPPPVPAIPAHLRPISHLVPSSPISPPSSLTSFSAESSPIRPPPRSAVPTDFEEFDLDDDSSVFSYGGVLQSARSQPSASPLDDAEFDIDLDHEMMLPLSLPGTPIDLEADFNAGLAELQAKIRSRPLPPVPEPAVTEGIIESISEVSFSPSVGTIYLPRSPTRDSWASFYVSEPSSSPLPSVASFPAPTQQLPPVPETPKKFTIEDEMRVLKSKWSSSTLGSIREEHEKRSPSRLRIFSPSKKQHQRTSSRVHSKPAAMPVAPGTFLVPSPIKKPSAHQRAQDAVLRGGNSVVWQSRESLDIGVRRRESLLTVSDSGSDSSTASSGNPGLRRKPIPVELFLRH